MKHFFYRSPFGLAEWNGLGRSALNNPRKSFAKWYSAILSLCRREFLSPLL